MRCRSAFTIIEVLIVVLVIGILAAIVVPEFSDASTDAKLSSLKTNLQTIRGQLHLYKLQHDGVFPTSAQTFEDQMTRASRVDGSTADVGTAGFTLGPYLQEVPANPYTGGSSIGSGAIGTSDWYYDGTTGEFRANNSEVHAEY